MVLTEQLGIPLPAAPVLLAMGALVGLERYSFAGALSLAMLAAVTADSTWYALGRSKGHSILRLLCRISLEPDSCVSTTRSWFKRLGAWVLVICKFVPGLSAVSTPMAGLSRMPVWKFLLADAAGSAAWAGTFIGLGYAFRFQLEEAGQFAMRLGVRMVVIVIGSAGLWIGWKFWQRKRFMKSLRVARITPEELMERLDDVVVLDLRSSTELDWDGMKLRGALWFDREALEQRHLEIPRDRDIVLYCT